MVDYERRLTLELMCRAVPFRLTTECPLALYLYIKMTCRRDRGRDDGDDDDND